MFYDCEEIEHDRNGLTRIERELPDWLAADLAILGEPTNGQVEAGCQGTASLAVTVAGRRAHSARSWLGDNAIHKAARVLDLIAGFDAATVDIDGCTYREGLNAVGITGGVASNVIPDECEIRINFRFAPDRTADAAVDAYRKELLRRVRRDAARRRCRCPARDCRAPAAAEFVAAAGGTRRREVRLDRRRPVRRPRHPGGELRTR